MATVAKRDGRRVAIDTAKLASSIAAAARASQHGDASLARELSDVVGQLLAGLPEAERTTARAAELTTMVLRETGHVSWAERYAARAEERRRKRAELVMSGPMAEERDGFSKGPLVRALMAEAQLGQALAEEVAGAVEQKLLRSGLRRVSSSLLRELADAELLERGHTAALRRSALVGLPQAALKDALFSGSALHGRHPGRLQGHLAEALLGQYSLDYLHTSAACEGHRRGRLHIEDAGASPVLHSALLDLRVALARGVDGVDCRLSPPRSVFAWLNNLRVALECARAHCVRRLVWPAPAWLAAPLLDQVAPDELGRALADICATPVSRGAPLRLCLYPAAPDFLPRLPGLDGRARAPGAAEAAGRVRGALLRGLAEHPDHAPELVAVGPDEALVEAAAGLPLQVWEPGKRLPRSAGVCGLPAEPRALVCQAVSGTVAINLPRLAWEAGPGEWEGFLARVLDILSPALQALGRRRRVQLAMLGRPSLPLWNLGSGDWSLLDFEDAPVVIAPVGLSEAIELLTGERLEANREAVRLAGKLLAALGKAARKAGRRHGLRPLIEPEASGEAAARFVRLDGALGLPSFAAGYETAFGARLAPRDQRRLAARAG